MALKTKQRFDGNGPFRRGYCFGHSETISASKWPIAGLKPRGPSATLVERYIFTVPQPVPSPLLVSLNNVSHAQALKHAFHPCGLFVKVNKDEVVHKQMTSIHPRTDVCACRDPPTSNHISSISTTKPSKTSTKPSHRRARPSIDKSQVSGPVPILAGDERDLYDVMASSNVQVRTKGVPKVAEKKVKINALEPTRSSPQPRPRVFTDDSRSWYTPVPVQPLVEGPLQRSIPNSTPRTIPFKANVGGVNPIKELKGRSRPELETRRTGVEPTKRHFHNRSITHPEYHRVESTGDQTIRRGHRGQQHPVRSETRGSSESDKTAVEDEAPARRNTKKEEGATPLVKTAQETPRPTVKLVSKPLPDPPAFDSVSSRWTTSTGSVYSDGDSFSYDKVLSLFPEPPKVVPNLAGFNDWEDFNSLSTPPIFMSRSNSSSSSVATITPMAVPDSPVKPLMLKAVPKPKVATIVHQIPRASHSFSQLQDSIVIRNGRAYYPQASTKNNIPTPSARTAGTTSTLRRRSSSFTSSHNRKPSNRIANLEALVFPHRRQTPEDIDRIERERLERERKYEIEEQKEQELKQFEMEFGYNPLYKGKKRYQREMDPNGFELIRPGKEKQRKWL